MNDAAGRGSQAFGLPRPRLTGLLAMAAAIGLSAWLLVNHQDRIAPIATPEIASATGPVTTSATSSSGPISAIVLTQDELVSRAQSLGQPLYWAGPQPRRRYELTRDESGNVFVRYLPRGVVTGDTRRLLTVSTLPLADAFARSEVLAGQPDAVAKRFVDGRLAFYRRSKPEVVYLVYPGVEDVIQVRDGADEPGRAREIVFSGSVRLVS